MSGLGRRSDPGEREASSTNDDDDLGARVRQWLREITCTLYNAKGEWEVQFTIPEGAHLEIGGQFEIEASSREATLQIRPAGRRRLLPEETSELAIDRAEPDEGQCQDHQLSNEASS